MHEGFVDVSTAVPSIIVEPRYASEDNFIGAVITGYNARKVMVSLPVALALSAVQQELMQQGLSIKIYDGYRPQRAVDHFMRWIKDAGDQKNKSLFYPDIDKSKLVEFGYIAEKSGHSRGGSVDVTLVDMSTSPTTELDMGSPWDLFDEISHSDAINLSDEAQANRKRLADVMIRNGFKPYAEEWWHFTLEAEPYPDTYFDFVIE